MFSGIVEGKAKVIKIVKGEAPYRLQLLIPMDFSDTELGHSIAVQGVCLTVVDRCRSTDGHLFSFDMVPETLRCTTLGTLEVGDSVNVERSLKLGERLHGHFVFGHVDATTPLLERVSEGNDAEKLTFALPEGLSRYFVPKGSVSIGGVSLTLGPVTDKTFAVYLVPHTLDVTTLSDLRNGSLVNIEVDMLARYALLPDSGH